MAESLLVRKGGGAAINGLIESYKLKAGENISPGDFVDILNQKINGVFGNKQIFRSLSAWQIKAVLIDTNKIFVAHKDLTSDSFGRGIIGTISGNNITWGSEYVFDASNIYDIEIILLETNKVLITYGASNGHGTGIIGTVNGTVISWGSKFVYNSGTTSSGKIAFIQTNKVVVVYRDVSFSNHGTTKVGIISGTNITWSAKFMFRQDNTWISSLLYLGGDRLAVNWSAGNSNGGYTQILITSGSTVTSGGGSNFVFDNTAIITGTSIVRIGSKAVIIYRHPNNNQGLYSVGTISSDLNSINWSPTPSMFTLSSGDLEATVIQNKIILAYSDNDSASSGKVIEGKISGNLVNWEAPTEFSTFSTHISVVSLENNVVINYRDTGNVGTSNVYTLSFTETVMESAKDQILGVAKSAGTGGQTIDVYVDETARPLKVEGILNSYVVAPNETINAGQFVDYINNRAYVGGVNTFENNSTVYTSSGVLLSDNKVLIAYGDSTQNKIISKIGTITGSTITWSTGYVVENNTTAYDSSSLVKINENTVVIAYTHMGNNYYGTVKIGTITNNTITWGSAFVFHAQTTGFKNIVINEAKTHLVLGYIGSSIAKSRVAVINADNTLTWQNAGDINNNSANFVNVQFLDNSKVVAVFNYQQSFYTYGRIKTGTISNNFLSWNSDRSIEGISQGITYPTVSVLNKNKILVSGNSTSNNQARAVVGTVSGSEFSWGTSIVFEGSGDYFNAQTLSETQVVVYYVRTNNDYNVFTSLFTVPKGSTTITSSNYWFQSPVIKTYYVGTVKLSSERVMGLFSNANQNNRGDALIFEDARLISGTSLEKVFGVAKTSGTAGQTVEVYSNT
jgi:hypothetical protein